MKPVFSIIIPVYNVAAYLRECLDSVLAQTEGDWEAICVDDGSTDGSGEILNEYAKRDTRFRVIHQKNQGVSVARNAGLDEARGEWIGFVDADDKIDKEWLRTARDHIVQGQLDVLRMRAKFWHDDDTVHQDNWDVDDCALTSREAIVKWAWENLQDRGWSYVVFAKRETIGSVRFSEKLKIREDLIFVLEVMAHAERFAQCRFDGYYYRWHAGSAYNGKRSIVESAAFPPAIVSAWRAARKMSAGVEEKTCRQKTARTITGMLLEWLTRCDRREWRDDAIMRSALKEARAAGLFGVPGGAKGRWMLPTAVFALTGSLRGFYFVQRGFEIARKMRNRILTKVR